MQLIFNKGQKQDDSSKEGFFKKNKSLVFLLPVAAALAVALVVIYSGFLNDKTDRPDKAPMADAATIDTPTTPIFDTKGKLKVEVLPQSTRSEDVPKENQATNTDPFRGPMYLKGTMINEKGGGFAIIETNGSTYIKKVNEKIGNFTISSIEDNKIVLDYNGKKMDLEFSAAKSSDGTSTN